MIARNATAVVLASLLAATGTALPAPALPAGSADTAEAQQSLRAPVTDENFYFVMADRFANGSTANDDGGLGSEPSVSGFDPTRKGFYNGGDLKGLLDKLDYIEGLGTTSIWLTPSFKNKAVQPADNSAGYHGYWITDFTQIDPHLGTNEDLKALIDEAHSRGMKVYFDIITNHTADVIGYEEGARMPYVSKDEEPYRTAAGEPFDDRDVAGSESFPALDPSVSFPYTPVLEPGEEDLKVPAWLNDPTLYHNRGDTTFAGEDAYYGDFFGLDDLFTEHPVVVDGMKDIYQTWIADFGVDGFRIDTMKHVDDAFWQEFGPDVLQFAHEQGKDEFFMFGEVYDTTKDFTSQYTTRNSMQAVLDFPFQDAARNFASRSADADQLGQFFLGDDWYTDADSNAYSLPTFLGNHDMGEDRVKSARNGTVTVTVPPLSAVVYEASGRIPASKAAPAISLSQPAPSEGDNGRMLIEADVDGSSFYQVSFEARTAGGDWTPIGTDDNAPYRVFHDVAALDPGTGLEYRAVVLDNKGHTAGSGVVSAETPAPVVTLEAPEENARVRDAVELSAVADPEKATNVVSFERSVDGGAWEEIASDSSSPAYTYTDDISGLDLPDDSRLQYRAVLGGAVSNVRTVTVGDPVVVQPGAVSVPGGFNSEMGCPGDWLPDCDQAQMSLGDDGLWRLTVDIIGGTYEYKVAIDKSWDENYGAGGGPGGSNLVLEHDGGPVTFTYDHRTHLITAE